MNMHRASKMVLFLLLQNPRPVFETDMGPGEGPREFEASSSELQLHESPYTKSRLIKTLKVSFGQRLPYDETRYRTIQAGRIRVITPSQVEGRMIGSVRLLFSKEYFSGRFQSVKLELKPGTIIEYLQYRAEGTCFLRVAGKVINGFCPPDDERVFHVENTPKTEWWIHVIVGDSQGWLLVTDSAVREVRQ